MKGHLTYKTVLLAGIMALLGGVLLKFCFEQLMFKHRDLQVEFLIKPQEDLGIVVSLNKLPGQFGAEPKKFELEGNQMNHLAIGLPENEAIKRVMLFCKPENADFDLVQVDLKGFYRTVSWNGEDLKGLLKTKSVTMEERDNCRWEDNVVKVKLDSESPILLLHEDWSVQLYKEISRDSLYLGLISSFLLFIILLSFSKTLLFWAFDIPAYDLLMTACFLGLVFIPFFSDKENESSENRTLAEKPALDQLIWKIPGQYNKYFDDHFPFRNQLANINNHLHLQVFNTSPLPDHLRIGSEGWLYLYVDEVRYAYRGDSLFSDEQLEKIQRILEEKARYLKNRNCDFYFIVPPLKHSVYPEYLPASLSKKGRINKREQVMAYLKEHSLIKVIDPLEMMKEKKDSVRIYYKTDSHWNQLGAFFTYQLMMNRMAEDHPMLKAEPIENFNIRRSISYTGDLLALINLHSLYYREPYHITPKKKPDTEVLMRFGTVGSEIGYVAYAHSDTTLPRMLMIRDSFTDYLRNLLSDHFSYSGYSWTKTLDPERVEKDKPDIVVFELMERFINHLLIENPEEIRREAARDQP